MNRSEIYYLFQFEIKIRINILTNNINKHLKRKEKSSKKEKKKKILLRLPFFMTQLAPFFLITSSRTLSNLSFHFFPACNKSIFTSVVSMNSSVFSVVNLFSVLYFTIPSLSVSFPRAINPFSPLWSL